MEFPELNACEALQMADHLITKSVNRMAEREKKCREEGDTAAAKTTYDRIEKLYDVMAQISPILTAEKQVQQ